MKHAFLILATLTGLYAQPRLVLTSPQFAKPGDTVTLTLSVDTTQGSNLTAAQWNNPVGITLTANQPNVPNHAVVCAATLTTCLVVGAVPPPTNGVFAPTTTFNALPLADGPLQFYNVQIPTTAAPGSTLTFAPTGPLGADIGANQINVVVVSASLTILNPLDLSGNGTVDIADAQIALARWLQSFNQADFMTLIRIVVFLKTP